MGGNLWVQCNGFCVKGLGHVAVGSAVTPEMSPVFRHLMGANMTVPQCNVAVECLHPAVPGSLTRQRCGNVTFGNQSAAL